MSHNPGALSRCSCRSDIQGFSHQRDLPIFTDMRIRNFGLTRITMDQIHDIIQDVEDLKYNVPSTR